MFVTGIFTYTFSPHAAMQRRLALHLVEIVGEHLERDRQSGHDLEQLACERS